jgi:3-isopropylmalate/(R)-2-methylmalate dehydratase large subunit
MRVLLDGDMASGVSAKDLILAMIGRTGAAGAVGYVIEYAGSATGKLSIESRMTIANMSVEAGAVAALFAADDATFAYLERRPYSPASHVWNRAVAFWGTFISDDGATFDREIVFDATPLIPQVTWGTSPEHVLPVTGRVPDPSQESHPERRRAMQRSLEYMDLTAGAPMIGTRIDKVFIGSCTNSRIEDIRAAAEVARGRKVAAHIRALVVPGSGLVKSQAEREGLDRIFLEAGFEWREPGCSMCLAMNDDRLEVGERCASTSNRNFEGRQGQNGRTHLMSPAMAAAAAVSGCIADVRSLMQR